MKPMNMFGGCFEQYVPYTMNFELLKSLELHKIDSKDKNKRIIVSAEDVLNDIITSDSQFLLEKAVFSATLTIGNSAVEFYPLGDNCAFSMFEKYLELWKITGDASKAMSCVWYYYSDDCFIQDDPSSGEFYHFFVVYGEEIVLPYISLLSSAYPDKMLLKNDTVFLSDDLLTQSAIARVFYKKWMKETMAGKIFKEKCVIKQGQNSIQAPLPAADDGCSGQDGVLAACISKLSKDVYSVKLLLACVLCVSILLFFLKKP